jgi:hypothetical protein
MLQSQSPLSHFQGVAFALSMKLQSHYTATLDRMPAADRETTSFSPASHVFSKNP